MYTASTALHTDLIFEYVGGPLFTVEGTYSRQSEAEVIDFFNDIVPEG
jgi:hypothetical protein